MDGMSEVEKLEQVLADAELLEDRCRKRLLRSSEASQQLRALEDAIRSVFTDDSDPSRHFDRRRREATDWWCETVSGYVDLKDCDNIARFVDAVRETLDLLEPEGVRDAARPKDQFYFSAGDKYRPAKQFWKVIKRANLELSVVDAYLDDAIFDYIESLPSGVTIKLLTGTRKPIFPRLLRALQQQQQAAVEARENTACHDRFVILDGTQVWQLGASINGFGGQAFMMNRVVDAEERARFLGDFEAWWGAGAPI